MKNRKIKVALIGNPNSGKSTIFNQLTKRTQNTGNWSQVTVEYAKECFSHCGFVIEIIDLPGIYDFVINDETSLDVKVAIDNILNRKIDLFINVIDSSNLEKSLYLTLQLRKAKLPMIIVCNMQDQLLKEKAEFRTNRLAKILECEVIPMIAHKNVGYDLLKEQILKAWQKKSWNNSEFQLLNCDSFVEEKICAIRDLLKNDINKEYVRNLLSSSLIESNIDALNFPPFKKLKSDINNLICEIKNYLAEDIDLFMANKRYSVAHKIYKQVLKRTTKHNNLSDSIDKIVLNRVLAIPLFLTAIYLLFFITINLGGIFQDFFAISGQALFIDSSLRFFEFIKAPPWLCNLVAFGIGQGITTTLTFIPIISFMFLALSFFEESGYMARAAFIADKSLAWLGLSGRGFAPLILGFGCTVPAISATRILNRREERILLAMMLPFISCGARLVVYVVIAAIFFPHNSANIVFILYLIGIIIAIFTAILLRTSILNYKSSPLIMEMSPYHLPRIEILFSKTWLYLKEFIIKAGSIIIIFSVIVTSLNNIIINKKSYVASESLLAITGKKLVPLFEPIGIEESNWQAVVGIISGIAAKEVVIGTLNSLYLQTDFQEENSSLDKPLKLELKRASIDLYENFKLLWQKFLNPFDISLEENLKERNLVKIWHEKFTTSEILSYLIFISLYFPCIASLIIFSQEFGLRWALFSMLWSTIIAYICAAFVYMSANFSVNPQGTFITYISAFTFFIVLWIILRTMRYKK